MKDNKLIAEFMELPKEKVGLRQEVIYGLNQDDWYTSDNLNYHLSWDWLMPVVQKIMDVSFFNGEPEDFYVVRDCIPEISNTYKVVVEFIKQYNNED